MMPKWYLKDRDIIDMIKKSVGDDAMEVITATRAFAIGLPKEFGIEITQKRTVTHEYYVPNWTHPRYNPLQPAGNEAEAVVSE